LGLETCYCVVIIGQIKSTLFLVIGHVKANPTETMCFDLKVAPHIKLIK